MVETKTVSGRVVTAAEATPPPGWSTDYADMGGDEEWSEDGVIVSMLESASISTEVLKPLFAMEAYTGGSLALFEAGSTGSTQYYFYSPIEGSLWRITELSNLTSITEAIKNNGAKSLKVEEVL
ncbi:hypothetical protein F4781DRAFT_35784 [Annulohypoxylon bovei var. microspora]|nr:hypothetical protein F4781DRAFT_35784 [Annulohypoxylon bovei var. microspora]